MPTLEKKETHIETIKRELRTNGFVSRNDMLRRFITRTASRIDDLEKLGWRFETKRVGGDYHYKLISEPELNLWSK